MEITRDEWLTALAEAGVDTVDDQSAVTATEFAALFDLPLSTAGHRLRRLVAAGCAVETRKRTTDSRGHSNSFKAYKLVAKPAKRKRTAA